MSWTQIETLLKYPMGDLTLYHFLHMANISPEQIYLYYKFTCGNCIADLWETLHKYRVCCIINCR